MIVTTAGRATGNLVNKAKVLASIYELPYKDRKGVSIETMKNQYQDDIVVVGKDQVFIAPQFGQAKLIFHPNLAMIRAKRIFKGEDDPLITIAGLKEGMSFLDCTLGLASDSIIASLAVGESGSVYGVEGNPLLYLLVREGLATFTSGDGIIDQAMRRINTFNLDHSLFLQQAETNSFDVVYFDPMFPTTIVASSGIQPIKQQALTTALTTELIAEAKRVARKRVIIKDHWQSDRFQALGFKQLKRKTSLFHYGVINIEG